jgi:hypothetical protein
MEGLEAWESIEGRTNNAEGLARQTMIRVYSYSSISETHAIKISSSHLSTHFMRQTFSMLCLGDLAGRAQDEGFQQEFEESPRPWVLDD